MDRLAKIFVAGHRGMVGSAIVRELERQGYANIITRTHQELDLCRQEAVESFFAQEKPEYVFLAAANAGCTISNQDVRADFLYDNVEIAVNVIRSAIINKCHHLVFIASSFVYPHIMDRALTEDDIFSAKIEKANEPYALSKLVGIKYCEYANEQYGMDYKVVIPPNLYGPNDTYDPGKSHVLAALIHRFHNAMKNNLPTVTCWGNGSALRDFLYVDDLATLCIQIIDLPNVERILNAGTGRLTSIKALTEIVAQTVGYSGEIHWDTTKPNGLPRIQLDVTKAENTGWSHCTSLEKGVRLAYADYLKKYT